MWKVSFKKTKQLYAIKEMSKVKIIDKKSEKSIKNEREFLSYLHNPFIVNMYYAFQDYENLYLVMDLLTGGDLRYHISKKKKFSESQTKFFIGNLLLGLDYIHKNNIIHRDIKPENLVLDSKGYLRITDFGVAKKNKKDNSKETSGTPGYMAPEVLMGQNHSFPVDFFAIGIMGYEFMIGKRPYIGKNRREIKNVVLRFQAKITEDNLDKNWSEDSINFINGCLIRKESNRLGYKNGCKELIEHSWFKDFNWDGILEKTIQAPFIPLSGGNYDKKYCEHIHNIGDETKERYNQYMERDEFLTLFDNYTFYGNNNILYKTLNDSYISSSNKNTKGNVDRSKNENNVNEKYVEEKRLNKMKIDKKNIHYKLNMKNNDKINNFLSSRKEVENHIFTTKKSNDDNFISERRNYKNGSLVKKLNKTNSSKFMQLNINDNDTNRNEKNNNRNKNIKPFKLPILHKNNSMNLFPQIKFNPKLNMDYLKNRIYAQRKLNLTRNANFFGSSNLVQKFKNIPLKKSESTGFLLSPISNVLMPKNIHFNTIQRNQNYH